MDYMRVWYVDIELLVVEDKMDNRGRINILICMREIIDIMKCRLRNLWEVFVFNKEGKLIEKMDKDDVYIRGFIDEVF